MHSVGGLRWFAENLRYRTPDSCCYENDDPTARTMAGFTDWKTR